MNIDKKFNNIEKLLEGMEIDELNEVFYIIINRIEILS